MPQSTDNNFTPNTEKVEAISYIFSVIHDKATRSTMVLIGFIRANDVVPPL